jgi:muramidase (phage lysozyme)
VDIFENIRRFAGDKLGGFFGGTNGASSVTPAIPQGPGGSTTGSGLGQVQQIQSTINPGERATLDTLARAEGTWDAQAGTPDYTMRFGDKPGQGSLDITAPHPRDVRGSRYGSGYRSNAAGAYQFLSDPRGHTWEEFNGGENAVMSPANQDAAAIRLIEQRTGYNFDEPFADQAHELSGTWASIPNRAGSSAYGQPVKDLQMLSDFHEGRLEHWEDEARRDVYRQRQN